MKHEYCSLCHQELQQLTSKERQTLSKFILYLSNHTDFKSLNWHEKQARIQLAKRVLGLI